jgi:DNA-binding transcriptional regulator YiaG
MKAIIYLREDPGICPALAERLNVSRATIREWAEGVNLPDARRCSILNVNIALFELDRSRKLLKI